MTHVGRVTILILAVMLTATFAPVYAEDDNFSLFDDIPQLDGLESAVVRFRAIDLDLDTTPGTPPPDVGDDRLATPQDAIFVYMIVMKFDGKLHAEAALDFLEAGFSQPLPGSADVVLFHEELDGPGDRAFVIDAFSKSSHANDPVEYARVAVARDNQFVFIALTLATTRPSIESSNDLLTAMVEDGVEGGPERFDPEGGSTGALWDYFPDSDHEALVDLVVGSDEILFPEPADDR